MVRQSALQIRCLADVFGLESGVTTEGSCSLFLYDDHVNSITRSTQLLKWYFAPAGYLDPMYPRSSQNVTTIAFHSNYTKIYLVLTFYPSSAIFF